MIIDPPYHQSSATVAWLPGPPAEEAEAEAEAEAGRRWKEVAVEAVEAVEAAKAAVQRWRATVAVAVDCWLREEEEAGAAGCWLKVGVV
jgi:hypothetical protein